MSPPTNPLEDVASRITNFEKRISHLERLEGGGAWNIIEDVLLGAPAANIDFVGIPQTYTHLAIKGIGRSDRALASGSLVGNYNGDLAANYEYQRLQVFQANVVAIAAGAQTFALMGVLSGALALANQSSITDIFIPNYKETTFEKDSIANTVSFHTANYGNLIIDSAHWQSTAAINRITLDPGGGSNFIAGTHLTLYGVN